MAIAEAKQFALIDAYDCPDLSHVGSAIQLGFVVQSGITVGSNFATNSQGIIPPRRGRGGGHGIYLIGWESINGEDYFRLVNSWKDSWGQHGMGWLPASYLSGQLDAYAMRISTFPGA